MSILSEDDPVFKLKEIYKQRAEFKKLNSKRKQRRNYDIEYALSDQNRNLFDNQILFNSLNNELDNIQRKINNDRKVLRERKTVSPVFQNSNLEERQDKLKILDQLGEVFSLFDNRNKPINEYNPFSQMSSLISMSKNTEKEVKYSQFKNSSLRNVCNPFISQRLPLHTRPKPKPPISTDYTLLSPSKEPIDIISTSIFQNETISSKSNLVHSQPSNRSPKKNLSAIGKIVNAIVTKAEDKIGTVKPKEVVSIITNDLNKQDISERKPSLVEISIPIQKFHKPNTSFQKTRKNRVSLHMESKEEEKKEKHRNSIRVKKEKKVLRNYVCKQSLTKNNFQPSRYHKIPNFNISSLRMRKYINNLKRKSQVKQMNTTECCYSPSKIHIHNLSYEVLPQQKMLLSPLSKEGARSSQGGIYKIFSSNKLKPAIVQKSTNNKCLYKNDEGLPFECEALSFSPSSKQQSQMLIKDHFADAYPTKMSEEIKIIDHGNSKSLEKENINNNSSESLKKTDESSTLKHSLIIKRPKVKFIYHKSIANNNENNLAKRRSRTLKSVNFDWKSKHMTSLNIPSKDTEAENISIHESDHEQYNKKLVKDNSWTSTKFNSNSPVKINFDVEFSRPNYKKSNK